MKNICALKKAVCAIVSICVCSALFAADGVWTNTAGGNWSDAGNWENGIIAGSGGSASFGAASGTINVANDLGTVSLSSITVNSGGGQNAIWNITGGTNALVSPAMIGVNAGSLSFAGAKLSAAVPVVVSGPGLVYLGQNNLLDSTMTITNGAVQAVADSAFGPVPGSPVADAITLDAGTLMNGAHNTALAINANRGIFLTPAGGFLCAGYASASLQVNAPVTGSGDLGINCQNSPVVLNSSANAYSGDTLVGTAGPQAYIPYSGKLTLGQNEVIPHGTGKGGLAVAPLSSFQYSDYAGVLDLNGKTETVNTLSSGPRATITTSIAGQGTLAVGGLDDDSSFAGTLSNGATLEKQGTGDLYLGGATLAGSTLEVADGTVQAGGVNLAGATVVFSGGDMEIIAPSGLYEYKGTSGNLPDLNATLAYNGWKLWPEKATATAGFGDSTQYAYRGRWYVDQAGTYSFGKSFDDGGYLAIDGVPLIHDSVYNAVVVTNNVAISAGWHDVEIRVANGGGGVGPQNGFGHGIMYDSLNGSFATNEEKARSRTFTDDGGTNLIATGRDNILAASILLEQDATITVASDEDRLVFASNLTTNAPTIPEPVLTVDNNGDPLLFGTESETPPVLDAALVSSGGIIFTNRSWLRRLPNSTYTIAPGADVALDSAALLGGDLNLTDYSVRIVRDDSVGGGGSVTANVGTVVWFDTMSYTDKALVDGASATLDVDNAVTLNNGQASFTGQGTITYGGALTGTGSAVKSGSGDLLLTGSASSLNGEIQITEGRLLPDDESALGGATVRISGGTLANPTGGDLTLTATPVIGESGSIEVTGAGETMTINSQVSGEGEISKIGAGTLVLGGTVINTNLQLAVASGTVELNKTGAVTDYAVKEITSIGTGALVKLTGSNGNQIGGGVILDGGALDLNGLDESIGGLFNGDSGGSVLNNGGSAATLTVGEGDTSSAFSAIISDGVSALSLAKIGTGKVTTVPSSLAYSGDTDVDSGTLEMKTQVVPVVAGLSYHLDAANTESLTRAGTKVTKWSDSSPAGVDFSQGTSAQQPTYELNAINGLPAVRFSDTASTRMYANKAANAQTVFIVARTTTFGVLDGIWGRSGGDYGIRGKSLGVWQDKTNGGNNGDFTLNGDMYINGKIGNTYKPADAYILTAARSSAYNGITHAIGNYWATSSGASRYFRGYIGEVLVYDRALSAAERDAVTAYLNKKWFVLPLGLSYQLDATKPSTITLSGSKVTKWVDTTVAAVNFDQSNTALQPEYEENVINGLPAVRFGDAVNVRMYANKDAAAQSVFIVAQTTAIDRYLAGIWGRSGQDYGIRADYALNPTTWRWWHPGNANDWSNAGQMYINGVAGNAYNKDQPYVLNAVRGSALSMTQAIGDYWGNTTHDRYFQGYIGEVLVFDHALSEEDRLRVNAYLMEKWLAVEPEVEESLAGTPVNIAADGTFKVTGFDLAIGEVAGSGTLAVEFGSATLGDYSGFSGTVTGDGTVALAATDGADATFLPQSSGVTIRNDGAMDADLVVGGSGTNIFIGSLQDGESVLGFVHSGTGTTLMSGLDSTYTGETLIENGIAKIGGTVLAKYIRFTPLDMRDYGSYLNSGCQYSEFHLMRDGVELAYPAGTLASSVGGKAPDASQGPNLAIDFNVTTKYYENPARALVVELPEPMLFDGYNWYTANDATGRDAVQWTVEVSDDGINWNLVDYRDYNSNQAAITLARNTLAGTWTFNQTLDMNVLSDLSEATLSAPAELAVIAVNETVGPLSGDGAITLQDATLGLNAFTDAAFSGDITGSGTIVKKGAAIQSLSGAISVDGAIIIEAGVLDLDGAVLTGITNIVIKTGGELTGSATVNGDLIVTFEGGIYSASLTGIDALSTVGTVSLGLPEGATYPVNLLLFGYASADQATRDALAAATPPAGIPEGYSFNVRVTDTYARMTAGPAGTLIMVR